MHDGKYTKDQEEAAGIIQPKGQDGSRIHSAHDENCGECSSLTRRMQRLHQTGK
jgi:hypothetical protein